MELGAPPPVVGRYHKLFELGRGGMSRVWLAVSTGPTDFRKLLVIKEVSPELAAQPRFKSLFFEEATLAAKLNHPNVVQTLEVFEHGGAGYLVMEYLEGQSLAAVLRRRSIPLPLTLRVLADVCVGLEYAHGLRDHTGRSLGIVHRDISPSNILITYSGQVKVLDFGLAKANDSSPARRSESMQGKVEYMAPERVSGAEVDRRADVFSVGVLLWEALAGRRIWAGVSGQEVAVRLRRGELPALPATADTWLAQVAMRATACGVLERYQTARDLQADLEQYLDAQKVPSGPRELAAFVAGAFEEERARQGRAVDEKMRELGAKLPPRDATTKKPSVERTLVPRPTVSGCGAETKRPTSPVTPEPPSTRQTEQPKSKPSSSLRLRMPDPYRVQGRLDGHRRLYQGVHARTGGQVVVQLVKGFGSTSQLVERYAAAGQLRHPNTAAILDVGLLDEQSQLAYVAREFVPGESMDRLLTQGRGPVAPATAYRWIAGALTSLADAHHRGIVHGRITPSHLIVRAQEVSVLGFWPESSTRPESEQPFVAPELRASRSRSGRLRPCVDVFSVGAVLKALLSGSTPSAQSAVPVDAAEIIRRAMARNPDERFQDGQDMLKALGDLDWSSDEGPSARGVDRYLVGASPVLRRLELEPRVHQLMAARPVTLWVLDDDTVINRSETEAAFAELSNRHEVRLLGPAERELAVDALLGGGAEPPWVLIFGVESVLAQDPLLRLLSSCQELTHVLMAEHASVSLLRQAVDLCGVDQYIDLPCEPQRILDGLSEVVQRTRLLSEHYDAIRAELRRGRDRIGERSRELSVG